MVDPKTAFDNKDTDKYRVIHYELLGKEKKWIKFIFETKQGEAITCMAHINKSHMFDSIVSPKFFNPGSYSMNIREQKGSVFRSLFIPED